MLDLLRVRLGDADAVGAARIHSFKELMADHAGLIGELWYWHAFEELEAQGHLDPASHKENGGDARGRLSAPSSNLGALDHTKAPLKRGFSF